MSRIPLALACVALGGAFAPIAWVLVALALGPLAGTWGLLRYRDVRAAGSERLLGAGALAVAIIATLLAAVRVLLSAGAAARLADLLGA